MASIDNALNSLEKVVAKERDLAVKEARALKKAVKRARKDAKARVKAEYKSSRSQIKKEKKAAEKTLRDAKVRIEKSLGTGKKKAKKKPAKKKPAKKKAVKKKAVKKTAKRPPRGSRSASTLAFFRKNPGTGVADAARAQGVSASTLYPVARELLEAGKVKKTGSKYTAVE